MALFLSNVTAPRIFTRIQKYPAAKMVKPTMSSFSSKITGHTENAGKQNP